ncbi:beta-galactoside alpha-2,6-sialyltransferase 2b isoform X2 [Denticeps clupeoides]|uniref:Beta-galactoside alpha-2,6-sialyltransferase 2 n=2 Tax=Denticeps clupeoides TaxID=299321 RepID=A0AAY4E6K5_9TELE|nr:beta-galactoside alpha-2,6-sialyltransferase 2-like isoform X2 [Denticeps clupeoides]XP_028809957.1 beta-galactoside alpha-2,6-sialyltransferase 2-like isoform X2 [Denticeps clupeoides]XP_028809958.1 beta-galactoside alpha-2,6-sialyltransferase 2-like isoform X2 [Denticeps clupeoides]XP_028809959.1 beta-galactoside alpha-2,6-sialyltransferase 2-like isoform X2 [Denticeps clupeoides]
MKQWKQFVLLGMLGWVVLFLALFSYFMDAHEHRNYILLSHAGTSHLTSFFSAGREPVHPKPRDLDLSPVAQLDLTGDAGQDIKASREFFRGSRLSWLVSEASEEQKNKLESVLGPSRLEHWQKLRMKYINQSKGKKDLGDFKGLFVSRFRSVFSRLRQGDATFQMLSPRLKSAMQAYIDINRHKVTYTGSRTTKLSGDKLLCQLKSKSLGATLNGTEQPFSKFGWDKLAPPPPLEKLYGGPLKSCAVVTSAGAILGSSLGKEIDSHDAVLRFNAAPTEGFEKDVGSKTTIRVINSQILANANHHFNTSKMYKDIALLAWDPAPYRTDLQKWSESPEFDLFTPYMERRRAFPDQPFYILHPSYLWRLWDMIQGNIEENIPPNPPSSGFIGIVTMMTICEEIHVYEYIPSMRQTDLCHYYEHYRDDACTLGAYHPLLYEKILVRRMSLDSEDTIKAKGRVTLPGFSTIHCGP